MVSIMPRSSEEDRRNKAHHQGTEKQGEITHEELWRTTMAA
jgi:hypothetical protein